MRSPIVLIATAVLVIAGVVGCTFAPDRKVEADRLESEIATMPGVSAVSVIYSNDFTRGVHLDIEVTMKQASEALIGAVVSRINHIEGDKFEEYDRSNTFTVGDELEVYRSGSGLDADRIAARARQLREIGASLSGTEMTWYDNLSESRIEIDNAPPAAESLAAVRHVLGNDPVRLDIRPEALEDPSWSVDLPFSIAQEQGIQQLLSELPANDVVSVRVDDARLSNLSIGLRAPGTAYQDLVGIIEKIGPTEDHPLMLSWGVPVAGNTEREFQGSAHIHGCPQSGNAGHENPERFYTPAAVDLQKRMQDEFETCSN